MNAKDKRSSRWAAVSLAAAAARAACGGDPATPPATSQVPASASESATGFIEYLKLLVASSADTLEPVDTSMVTAPTDDTGEPAAVP